MNELVISTAKLSIFFIPAIYIPDKTYVFRLNLTYFTKNVLFYVCAHIKWPNLGAALVAACGQSCLPVISSIIAAALSTILRQGLVL